MLPGHPGDAGRRRPAGAARANRPLRHRLSLRRLFQPRRLLRHRQQQPPVSPAAPASQQQASLRASRPPRNEAHEPKPVSRHEDGPPGLPPRTDAAHEIGPPRTDAAHEIGPAGRTNDDRSRTRLRPPGPDRRHEASPRGTRTDREPAVTNTPRERRPLTPSARTRTVEATDGPARARTHAPAPTRHARPADEAGVTANQPGRTKTRRENGRHEHPPPQPPPRRRAHESGTHEPPHPHRRHEEDAAARKRSANEAAGTHSLRPAHEDRTGDTGRRKPRGRHERTGGHNRHERIRGRAHTAKTCPAHRATGSDRPAAARTAKTRLPGLVCGRHGLRPRARGEDVAPAASPISPSTAAARTRRRPVHRPRGGPPDGRRPPTKPERTRTARQRTNGAAGPNRLPSRHGPVNRHEPPAEKQPPGGDTNARPPDAARRTHGTVTVSGTARLRPDHPTARSA